MAIAVLLGGAVFWLELERIDDEFVAQAVEEARELQRMLPPTLSPDAATAAQTALDVFLADRHRLAKDHFSIAEVYDRDQKPVAEAMAADAVELETAVDRSTHHFPLIGDSWYAKHMVRGRLYLQVVTPLAAAGAVVGWFEGVYRVTPASLDAATRDAGRAVITVILAVLATTGLLYPIIVRLNRGLVSRSQALLDANLGTLEALGSAIAKRDSDTGSHNYRVTLYAVRLAEAVGLPPSRIRALVKGAFLHDIGKLAIPDAILLKPGKLDDAEFTVMKTHVSHGIDVVRRFQWLDDAADVVGHHHEKYDGSGYMSGLTGEDIPINARIFAIADVFDALTSRRPYKDPMPVAKALAVMFEGRGNHFDPALLDVFVAQAAALHAETASRDEDGLATALRSLTRHYFAETVSG